MSETSHILGATFSAVKVNGSRGKPDPGSRGSKLGLFFDWRGEGLQGPLDEFSAEARFLIRLQLRISDHVGNPRSRDDPVRADVPGNGDQRRDHNRRNSRPVHFFGDR